MATLATGGRAVAFDRARSQGFLEKADVALPDERLETLRDATDAELGIDERLLRKCAEAFDLGAARPARSALQGTFHRLYDLPEADGGFRMMRIAALPGERWASLMALEARLGSMLQGAGLPVPACEFSEVADNGAPRGVQVMARVPGRSLAQLDSDETRTAATLVWVGRFLCQLHRLPGRGAGPLSLEALERAPPQVEGVHSQWDDFVTLRLEEHLHDCERAGDLGAAEAATARGRFAGAREHLRAQRMALLHGDPGGHNFVVDEEAIRGVIDWEDALVGDPLFDLASLCTFHPERRHAAIHAGYGAAPAPGTEAWERFWLYFLRIALAKTVHRRRFGYADRPGREPAARRIQLALARLEGGAA